MTRENKLALVVGFGLLLLVGILVSDHFSPARVEAAGDLRAGSDPGAATRTTEWDRSLEQRADAGGPRRAPAPPDEPELPGDQTPPTITNENRTRDDATASPVDREGREAREGRDPGSSSGGGVIPGSVHVVVAGDTLEGITVGHYGDRRLIAALAAHNRITDPSTIRLGQRIELPPAAFLRGDAGPAIASAAGSSAAARTVSTRNAANWFYIVRKGDTLSEIAAEQLGTSKAWTLIIELNRDILPRTTDLQPGQRLRMPPRPR
jgi:nucleoid-associated protein YgaU